VLQLSHGNGTTLGITVFLQFAPILLGGMWGGAMADRYSKRRILSITQLFMGGYAAILGILVLSGIAQVWQVFGLAFALGCTSVVGTPAYQSFIVEMVGPRDLTNAIALNSASYNLSRIIGPALAGLMITWLGGTGPVFLANALSFIAATAALAVMRQCDLICSEPVRRAKGQLYESLRYACSQRQIITPIILVTVVSSFGANITLNSALMATDVYHVGASTFGLASTAFAVGAIGGALLAARRAGPSRWRLIPAAFFFCILVIFSGLAPTYFVFLAALVPAGIALMIFNATANSCVQLACAAPFRGRVMGLYTLVFNGGIALGGLLLGHLGETLGPRASIMASGLLSLAGVGLALLMEVHAKFRFKK
jgi:predicted MFS family arabinose efflux permease